MSKNYKRLTADECYNSYRTYEIQIEHMVKTGSVDRRAARLLLNSAKKNYKRQSYNRQVDIINES
jgi:hypothetical protein